LASQLGCPPEIVVGEGREGGVSWELGTVTLNHVYNWEGKKLFWVFSIDLWLNFWNILSMPKLLE
jgi:hypothetical protein